VSLRVQFPTHSGRVRYGRAGMGRKGTVSSLNLKPAATAPSLSTSKKTTHQWTWMDSSPLWKLQWAMTRMVIRVAQSLGGFTAPMVRKPVQLIVLLNPMTRCLANRRTTWGATVAPARQPALRWPESRATFDQVLHEPNQEQLPVGARASLGKSTARARRSRSMKRWRLPGSPLPPELTPFARYRQRSHRI
jgi:hypothetical protein